MGNSLSGRVYQVFKKLISFFLLVLLEGVSACTELSSTSTSQTHYVSLCPADTGLSGNFVTSVSDVILDSTADLTFINSMQMMRLPIAESRDYHILIENSSKDIDFDSLIANNVRDFSAELDQYIQINLSDGQSLLLNLESWNPSDWDLSFDNQDVVSARILFLYDPENTEIVLQDQVINHSANGFLFFEGLYAFGNFYLDMGEISEIETDVVIEKNSEDVYELSILFEDVQIDDSYVHADFWKNANLNFKIHYETLVENFNFPENIISYQYPTTQCNGEALVSSAYCYNALNNEGEIVASISGDELSDPQNYNGWNFYGTGWEYMFYAGCTYSSSGEITTPMDLYRETSTEESL